ncbi:aminoacyl-tRNA hydrolase [Reichenbachiella agarivorans]|uniref:Peptidyl-tRNA hydrolase n=1 Tax=Reichenbachiella agarivorans TaxID=2979464 RepID=A0ABY6CKX2_9BACT|nr:aminoacyl-tRNA hydrolase [Reichenbachiella agarivorans]UXP31177.1 aminoacyl-tRNA hydrolase [Reichenbachiella agarivorans]
MKYLIIGLGNIGPEYELTRHNIGFLILDKLAHEKGVEFDHLKLANKTEFKHKGRTIHLIKPTTYMNLSGKSVNYWMQELKVDKANILVVMDDIALPYGNLRMRPKGSHAGHNGLRNIDEMIGGNDYTRLKFGVGNDFRPGQQADYVLSNFSKDEMIDLPLKMDKACEMILSFCTLGTPKTMSQYND